MCTITVTEKDIGKRVTFRSPRMWNSAKATRVIRGIGSRGGPIVYFGGYTDFCVRPHEVIEILEKE